jgi:membrane-associated phospholipid phosphatase
VAKSISSLWRISNAIFSTILILTVSISHIHLGAHGVTDLIGGYSFGLVYLGMLLEFYSEDRNFNRL